MTGTPGWSGAPPELGEVFVAPKSSENARDLLAAAEALGLEALVVRTVQGGFIVPAEVHTAAETARATREGRDY